MKKFLLSVYLISVLAFMGYAQNLTLSHGGTAVPNNGTVTFTGEPSTGIIEAHIDVINNGTSSLNVFCKKTEISLVTNSVNTFCWDNCYPPNVYVSLGTQTIVPGVTNTSFIGEYQPVNNPGQSVIRYTFFVDGNPNDSVCFRAFYNAYPLGIEGVNGEIKLSNAYPNPANSQASFTVTGCAGQTVVLMLRNVIGSTVSMVDLAGEGTYAISTRDLPEGIYFYSMIVNGKITLTRKLVISH